MKVFGNNQKSPYWIFIYIILLAIPFLAFPIETYDSPLHYIMSAVGLLSLMAPIFLFRILPNTYLWMLTPLVAVTSVHFAHIILYGEWATIGAWAALFESNPLEAKEYLTENVKAAATATTILLIHLSMSAIQRNTYLTLKKPVYKGVLSVILILGLGVVVFNKDWYRVYPFVLFITLQEMNQERSKLFTWLAQKQAFRFDAVRNKGAPNKREVYVIVIGETVRKQNLSLYGYYRDTTPQLRQLNDVVIFDNAISSATQTSPALTTAFSTATIDNLDLFYQQKSVVSLAKEAGFTVAWLSNQGRYGFADTPITLMSREANYIKFTNTDYLKASLDGKLLVEFDRYLRESDEQKLVVFIHLLGSHMKYADRYPQEFAQFKPEKKSREEKVIAEYNNTILYSDWIISQIIQRVKALNIYSSVIYFSDHGEELFDIDGRLGHGLPSPHPTQVEIPFIVWRSDKLIQFHDLVDINVSNQATQPIELQMFFHAFCGYLLIDSSYCRTSLNFFGSHYMPPMRRYFIDVDYKRILYVPSTIDSSSTQVNDQ